MPSMSNASADNRPAAPPALTLIALDGARLAFLLRALFDLDGLAAD